MNYIVIAKIVNTHGLKGEVKVLCNYYGRNYRNWKPQTTIYLAVNDHEWKPLVINTIRNHQQWLLITFANYDNINQVLFMKQKNLAIAEEQISDDQNLWINQDLISYQAINIDSNEVLGQVSNLIDNHHSGLWEIVDQAGNSHYVPNNKFFIIKVDSKTKQVYLKLIPGMFNYESKI